MSLTINSFDSNSINTLFSSIPQKGTGMTGIENLLGDYSSIRTGSYSKLLSAYYAKFGDDGIDKNDKTVKSKDTAEYSSVEKVATNLLDATNNLLDKSSDLWKKKSYTDDEGNTKSDYDKNAVYGAVKDFVDAYNDLVDKGQKSSNTGILTQVASMVTSSSSTHATLGQIGITIDTKNHLAIDEDFFKNKADMTTVKSLFTGNGGYAYSVASKASMVKSYANNALSDLTGKKTYTNSGSYDLSAGDILSSFNIST